MHTDTQSATNPPTITDELYQDAQRARYDADPDGLWATHVLYCVDCGAFNVVAPAGARRDILDDGYPVSEVCHGCERPTRQYDVKALWRQQSD